MKNAVWVGLACAVAIGCGAAATTREGHEARRVERTDGDEPRPGAVAARPDPCAEHVSAGVAHLEAGEPLAAERSLMRAVRADRECVSAYLNLAIVQRQTERLDEALLNVRRALAIDAQSVHGLHQLVLVHLAEARDDTASLELAALACRQALIVDETFAPLLNTCGIVDVERGRIVEALARFERAFELDPRLYEAWMNFGQITLSFRGYEDAERAFRGALEAQPGDYDARIGLGVALRGLGRFDEARTQYEAARTDDPERPEAWYDLGLLHQEHLGGQLADLARAELFFETFVRKASGDPAFSETLDEVTRCCASERSVRARRECLPGRLQNVRAAIDAISRAATPRGC